MVRQARDGRTWRIGTEQEVAWIADGTSAGLAITAAIPPVFEAYATLVRPGGEGQEQHDQAVLARLSEYSAAQAWWLGYLDTGPDDIVFPRAPMVTLYAGDDDWTCVGGPAGLVDRLLRDPELQARQVALGQDATPPGHRSF
jgi:hypothetical protein